SAEFRVAFRLHYYCFMAEEYDVLMKSGKSCFKCRDCTKRRNPSSTVLIDNDDGAGATPISAGTKLNIGTGDCDGTAHEGVTTEILALLTELTSRLDVLTAEMRNPSARHRRYRHTRKQPLPLSRHRDNVETILRLRLVRLVTSEIEHVNLFLSTTSVEMLQMREAEEIVNLPTRMATLSSRKGGPSPPREPTLKIHGKSEAHKEKPSSLEPGPPPTRALGPPSGPAYVASEIWTHPRRQLAVASIISLK
ncbi:hypothetical protein HPB47_012652, partial [Ixodes persulcatus]